MDVQETEWAASFYDCSILTSVYAAFQETTQLVSSDALSYRSTEGRLFFFFFFFFFFASLNGTVFGWDLNIYE